MSKRLQVILEDTEMHELKEAARRHGVPLSEWVRRTLRDAQRRDSRGDMDAKLRAVRAAVKHSFPTADIDEMLAEIERGYGASVAE